MRLDAGVEVSEASPRTFSVADSSPQNLPSAFDDSAPTSPIDIDPRPIPPTHQSSFNSIDTVVPTPPRGRLDRLRIGSSGASSLPIGGSSTSHSRDSTASSNSPARLPNSTSTSSFASTPRSRESSFSTNTGGLSPAASFLSSFSPPPDQSSLMEASGRFTALMEGDAEGFTVEGGYILGRLLGTGGFGVVREAKRTGCEDDRVAIKVVRHEQRPPPPDPVMGATLTRQFSQRSTSGFHVPNRRRSSVVNDRNRSASTPVPPHIIEPSPTGSPAPRGESTPPLRKSTSRTSAANTLRLSDLSVSAQDTPPLPDISTPSLIRTLLEREIHLWQQLAPHPHIIQLIASTHAEDFSYIVMPLCEGGNLLDYLNSGGQFPKPAPSGGVKTRSRAFSNLNPSLSSPQPPPPKKGLPLAQVLPIFSQVVAGLAYLHSTAYVTHKDLKLENILYSTSDQAWKIADFGLAEPTRATVLPPPSPSTTRPKHPSPHASSAGIITPGTPLSSLSRANSLSRPDTVTSFHPLPALDSIDHHLHPAGSLPYAPPEQMRSPVPLLEQSVDMWSLGCVLYALVEGKLPIEDEFEPRLRSRVMKGDWEVPTALVGEGKEAEEEEVLEVLKGLLESDPSKRWEVDRVQQSRWFRRLRTGTGPPTSPVVEQPRGRSASRYRTSTRPSSRASSKSGHATPDSSTTTSSSVVGLKMKKTRSTSRSSSAVKHLGVDDRTRSMERNQVEREERKARWDVARGDARSKSRSESRGRGRSHRGNGEWDVDALPDAVEEEERPRGRSAAEPY